MQDNRNKSILFSVMDSLKQSENLPAEQRIAQAQAMMQGLPPDQQKGVLDSILQQSKDQNERERQQAAIQANIEREIKLPSKPRKTKRVELGNESKKLWL